MHSAAALKVKRLPKWLYVKECVEPQAKLNQFMYQAVGTPWKWVDKISWSEQIWQTYVERDNLRTWLALEEGSIAGYFELERSVEGDVEIIYFGLMPEYIDRGISSALLSFATEQAWQWDAKRVWVHTGDFDHPATLNNYKKRGFDLYEPMLLG